MKLVKFKNVWDGTYHYSPVVSYGERLHSLEEISGIYLILGRACNFRCKHCEQNLAKNFASTSRKISDDTFEYIVKWAKARKNYKFIMFWGGEPLLYMTAIKDVVARLKDRGITDINFQVFTNGKALTEDIINYFEENDFYMTMSCDGPNPVLLRSEPPTENAIRLFNAFNGIKRINSVYTAKTESLLSSFKYLYNIFPNTRITNGWITAGVGVDESFVDFPEGKIERDFVELYKHCVANEDYNGMNYFVAKYYRVKTLLAHPHEDWEEHPIPYCGKPVTAMAIGLDGEIYHCHNGNGIIGNIKTDDLITVQDAMMKLWKENTPITCYKCPVAALCGCSCTIFKKTEDGTALVQCPMFKQLYGYAYNIIENGIDENDRIIGGYEIKGIGSNDW